MCLDLRVVLVVFIRHCVFVDPTCLQTFQSVGLCGPHGSSETDGISISLAGGLYSSVGGNLCGSLCGDHQHLLDGQHNVQPKHES